MKTLPQGGASVGKTNRYFKRNILSATRNSRGEGASDMKSIYEL